MRRFVVLLFPCLIGTATGGCKSGENGGNSAGAPGGGGASGGGGGGGMSNPVGIEQLTSEFAAIFCQQMRTCCGPDDAPEFEPELVAAFATDSCAASPEILEHVNDQFNVGRIKESIAGGRATFDQNLARTCLEALRALPCPNWASLLAGQQAVVATACRNMVVGTVADGQPCPGPNLAHECASVSCSGGDMDVCSARLPDGARCEDRCEDIFDCDHLCAGELKCSSDGVCAMNPTARDSEICDGQQ